MLAVADRTRSAFQVAGALTRLAGERFALPSHFGLAPPSLSAPARLLASPPVIPLWKPARAAEFYAGHYAFAGVAVDADGRSAFSVAPPSEAWAAALHGFAWLSDLRAAETFLARAHARSLIEDWLSFGHRRWPATRVEVAARRVLSWLAHAPFLLEGAEPGFERRFLRSLGRQVRRLRREGGAAPAGLPRAVAAVALTAAGLCLPDAPTTLRIGVRRLEEEIAAQVLPDGGHVSRNPEDVLALLTDLIPLRQTFAACQLEPPPALVRAIERMLPMIRFFRHGEGAFALFNGAGAVSPAHAEAVLAFDDVRGRPLASAPHVGYQRMEGGASVVLVDAGMPPPSQLSADAHAGCLAFEFSVGRERLVTNCGPGRGPDAAWRSAGRATAAHSTATVGETSSCRFVRGGALRRLIGPLIVAGPRAVEVARSDGPDGSLLRASHDGYARGFGLLHERTLHLAAGGDRLDGVDVFRQTSPRRGGGGSRVALRFHLHPDVRASKLAARGAALLVLPSGQAWIFSAEGMTVALEESIHLAHFGEARRSEQIVIHADPETMPRIAWAFERRRREIAPSASAARAPAERLL